MTAAGYLRFPHLHGDLIAFVAEDDVWLGPVAGGRAWRVSADQAQASHPRIARDGTMIAWTSRRDGPPEVYLAGVEGGNERRLTYWGDQQTRVCGWDPAGAVLAVTAAGQPFSHFTWAYALSVAAGPDGGANGPDGGANGPDGGANGPDGGPDGGAGGANGPAGGPDGGAGHRTRRLPFGPISDLSVEESGVALLTGGMAREPAYWKRYRGGTAGLAVAGRRGRQRARGRPVQPRRR